MLAQDPGMDREVVDALPGLALDLLEDDLVAQGLERAADDHAVDRHGANGNRRMVDDGLAAGAQVAARRQVHQGVGAVALCPAQLLDLLVDAARDRRCPDVGVYFGGDHAPDAGRVEPPRRALAAWRVRLGDRRRALRPRLVAPEAGPPGRPATAHPPGAGAAPAGA